MLEAVQDYFSRVEAINARIDALEAETHAAYEAAMAGDDWQKRNAARGAYNDRNAVLRDVRTAERHAAWVQLKLSGDPVVAYIAQHFENNYREVVEELLPELPMTAAELRAYGEGRNWCGDFYTHLRRLITNGIMSDDLTPAWRGLEDWIVGELGANRIPGIMAHLRRLAAELTGSAEPTEQEGDANEAEEPDPQDEPAF